MPVSRFFPIGFDVNETISMQARLHLEALEKFISCCLVIKSEELNHIYEEFRSLSPQIRKQIISNPLFNVAIHNLVQGLRESSDNFIFDGIVQLKWLIDGFNQKDFWAPLSLDNSIYLPYDGIVLQSNKPVEGLHIHREPHGLTISIDQSKLELKFNRESSFLSFDLDAQHWLTAWKFNENVFQIDPISSIYTGVVPDDYEREWLAPQELKKWSKSLSEAVQLLELCGLEDILTELKLLVSVIVPLKFRKDSHMSSSSPEFPSVICMSWDDDILQILEAMVHEAGHHKLCLVERESAITNSSEAIFHSPWRDDLRPARGLIHGAFAFLGIAVLWDFLLKSTSLSSNYIALITRRKRGVLSQIQDALSELAKVNCLTETGVEVVESIKRIHESLVSDCSINLAIVEEQTGGTSFDKNRHDQFLINELSKDYDWVLPLYESTKNLFDHVMERVSLSENAALIVKQRLPYYFLWWAIPLVECFKLTERLDEAKYWIHLHICFGLIWRFVDEVEDGHSNNLQEQLTLYDAALGLLIEAVEHLKSQNVHFSPRLRRLLFQFYSYRSIEMHGNIRVKDIWRRASAFLVVPYILRAPESHLFKAYREYCIFLGLLDDLEDGWEDLSAKRRTWVTHLLSTKSLFDCRFEFQNKCDHYKKQLLKMIPADMTLWTKLLDNSFKHADYIISKLS